MIALECLGPLSVTVDGGDPPPELLWRKHLALLVYLASSPKGATRDHLIGLLWPEKPEPKARHSLNEALRVLRRTVGKALTTDGDVVRLDGSAVTVDVDDLSSADIRGVFLEGFSVPDAPAFEDWLAREREHRRVLVLDHLDGAAGTAIARGALTAARQSAQLALAIEPRHEPATRMLMRVYALEGSRVLAIQAFERLAVLLRRDYDLEPDEETAALASRIQRERMVGGVPAAMEEPTSAVPLIGSGSTLLALASDVWGGVKSGTAGVIVLRGASGTGKSRISDEIAARARLDGAVVTLARGLDGDTAGDIWLALFRGGLDVPELGGAAPEALASLAALDPDLRHRFPGDAAVRMPVGDAVRHVLRAIADVRPVLVALDDAHRVDPSVIALFSSMVQRADGAAVCVVMTAPDMSEAVDVLCEHVGRDVNGSVLRLKPFDSVATEQLVEWAFPTYERAARERLARRVLAETAGNPFLAVEFVKAVTGGLSMGEPSASAVWPAESRTLDQTMPGDLPETVAAALRLRFRALSEPAQAILCTVAVVGGTRPLADLARGSRLSDPDAEAALDELEWARWLGGDARGYTFVTKLAREVVLADMITGGERRRIRDRVGLG